MAVILAACSTGSIHQTGADLPALGMSMSDRRGTAPASMAPGLVRVEMINTGQEAHAEKGRVLTYEVYLTINQVE